MARDTGKGGQNGRRSQATAMEEEVKETLVDGAEISFAPVAKDHKKTRRGGGSREDREKGRISATSGMIED